MSTVELVVAVTLFVPLFSSLVAPVTNIKSPTIALPKILSFDVMVLFDAEKVRVVDVSATLFAVKSVEPSYVPLGVLASGSLIKKAFVLPFKRARNDCQFTAVERS